MTKDQKEKEIQDIQNKLLDIKLAGYQLLLEKALIEVLEHVSKLKKETAFKEDREENIYNVMYNGIPLEELKPYVLVVGCIGVGKTTYINGAKKWDHKRRYFSIQTLHDIPRAMLKHADQIIKLEMLKFKEEDDIKYE